MIVLPISADTYFKPMHVSDVKGSGSKVEGSVFMPLFLPELLGGLFLTLRWSSVEQRRSVRQTGRAHLLQHPAELPLWKHQSAMVGLSVTDMYHNKCLEPSITWSLGFYLALSSP